MSEQDTEKVASRGNKSFLTGAGIGIVVGVLLCGVAIVGAMPKMMIVTQKSLLGFGLGRRRWQGVSVEDEHALDGEDVRR